MKSRSSVSVWLVVIVGLAGLTVPSLTIAADTLSLDPAVIRLTMRPGESWRGQVRIANGAAYAVALAAGTANLSRDGGTEAPVLGEDLVSKLGTLASWIRPGASVLRLGPGAADWLPFSIVIPENAAPGTHRGLLVLSRLPADTGGNALATTAAVAMGVELTVVGQPNHHISLGDMAVSPRFGSKPPVSVMTTVVNTGNTLSDMRLTGSVRRLWGSGADFKLAPDSGSTKSAPGSVAVWRGIWDGGGLVPIGLFRMTVTARDSSGTYEASRWFVLLPAPALFGLMAAAFIVLWGRRFWPRFGRLRRERKK